MGIIKERKEIEWLLMWNECDVRHVYMQLHP